MDSSPSAPATFFRLTRTIGNNSSFIRYSVHCLMPDRILSAALPSCMIKRFYLNLLTVPPDEAWSRIRRRRRQDLVISGSEHFYQIQAQSAFQKKGQKAKNPGISCCPKLRLYGKELLLQHPENRKQIKMNHRKAAKSMAYPSPLHKFSKNRCISLSPLCAYLKIHPDRAIPVKH